MKTLNIAAYYSKFYCRCGAEKVVSELIGRSRHDWSVFTNYFDPDRSFLEPGSTRIHVLKKISADSSIFSKIRNISTLSAQKEDISRYDVLMLFNSGLDVFASAGLAHPKKIMFCHTPVRFFYDDLFSCGPDGRGAGLMRKVAQALRPLWQCRYKPLWNEFRTVLVNSEEVRKRVVCNGLAGPEHTRVVHPGAEAVDTIGPAAGEKYFFVPGLLAPKKNIELAVRAFEAFLSEHPDTPFRLKIAGSSLPEYGEYARRLEGIARSSPAVELIRDPSDERYRVLFRDCYAVIYPSVNEDWGIIPVEAMAQGKPVVASRYGGPAESILDGQTGFLCRPAPSEFSRKMALLAGDKGLAGRMGRLGKERAALFGWDRFVKEIDSVIEDVYERP